MHPEALLQMGVILNEGIGVGKNPKEAKTFFYEGADRCAPEKVYDLGVKYYGGIGVGKDYSVARYLFRIAARKGLPEANYSLGDMYLEGKGGERRFVSAVVAYKSAAGSGHDFSMIKLGDIYCKEGPAKNLVEAYQWYILAKKHGSELADDHLRELEKQMSPDDIAKAKKRAVLWEKFNTSLKHSSS